MVQLELYSTLPITSNTHGIFDGTKYIADALKLKLVTTIDDALFIDGKYAPNQFKCAVHFFSKDWDPVARKTPASDTVKMLAQRDGVWDKTKTRILKFQAFSKNVFGRKSIWTGHQTEELPVSKTLKSKGKLGMIGTE